MNLMYRIGEFSKLSKTPVKTLRFYDQIGLLTPHSVDMWTNYRYYTLDQLMTCHTIKSLQQAGLTIEEIRRILCGHDKEEILQKRKAEIESELNEKKEQITRLEFMLQGKTDETSACTVSVKHLPEMFVCCKELIIPDAESYFSLLFAEEAAIRAAHIDQKNSQSAYSFIVYLDTEYLEKDFRVELCLTVPDTDRKNSGLCYKTIPELTLLSVMYNSSQNVETVYMFALEWITENGYSITGYPRESYFVPERTPDNSDAIITELQIPVRKNLP